MTARGTGASPTMPPLWRRPRSGWLWLLAVTLVISALALWVDAPAPRIDGQQAVGSLAMGGDGVATRVAGSLPTALPESLPLPDLEPAVADPFVGPATSAPVPPPKPAPMIAAPVPAPAPPAPPVAPPLSYRFFGRMVGPGGEVLTFLARADQVLAVRAGQALDDGHVVEAVDDAAVRLKYLPLGLDRTIAIAAPAAEPLKAGWR